MHEVLTLGVLLTVSLAFTVNGYAQEVDLSTLLNQRQAFQAPVFAQFSDCGYLLGAIDVEEQGQRAEMPPLSSVRFTCEVVAGITGGMVGAIPGLVLALVSLESGTVIAIGGEPPPGFGVGLVAAYAGYFLGCAYAVYVVGNIGNETGSFLAALKGSGLGCLIGIPFVVSATEFNRTRRYKTLPAEYASAERVVRIGSQILVGLGGGLAGSLVGGVIGSELGSDKLAYLMAVTGYTLSSAYGVYVVGNLGNERGSFLATLGGSTIGSAVGLILPAIGLVIGSDGLAALGFVTVPAGSLIDAIIGFDVTRRYKSPTESETASVNFGDGQVSLAIPRVYFRPDSFGGRGLSQRVDLLRVRF